MYLTNVVYAYIPLIVFSLAKDLFALALSASLLSFDSILEASKRLEGKIVRTPILQSKYINEKLESNIFLKAENLQTIGAFKFRGAMN